MLKGFTTLEDLLREVSARYGASVSGPASLENLSDGLPSLLLQERAQLRSLRVDYRASGHPGRKGFALVLCDKSGSTEVTR